MYKDKSDLGTLHRKNSALVLDVIRHMELVSRADIAKATKLTPAAVSSIIDELISYKIIQEVGLSDDGRVGRKAVMLSINSSELQVISVDFNNDEIFFGIVNLKGQYQKIKTYENVGDYPAEKIFSILFAEIDEIIADMARKSQILLGLGIAFPAPLDATGKILHTGTFIKLQNYSIAEVLKSRYPFPIYVENDADAAALAESWFGNWPGVNSLFFVLLEKGIGSGFVIKGNLFRGQNRLSSELGHMTVISDGPLCHCGNFGCLETVASSGSIAKEALEMLRQQGSLQLPAEDLDIEHIFKLIFADKQLSDKLFSKVGTYLGMALANTINLLTPDIVVLGGIIAEYPGLIGKLVTLAKPRIHPIFREAIPIEVSKLGRYAPLIGAASLIIKDVYHDPLSIKKLMDVSEKEDENIKVV